MTCFTGGINTILQHLKVDNSALPEDITEPMESILEYDPEIILSVISMM